MIARKPFERSELEKIAWAIPLFSKKGIYGPDNSARVDAFVVMLRWTGLRIRDVVQLRRSQVQNGRVILRTHTNQKPIYLCGSPTTVTSVTELNIKKSDTRNAPEV